jgi:hypothetical protein
MDKEMDKEMEMEMDKGQGQPIIPLSLSRQLAVYRDLHWPYN